MGAVGAILHAGDVQSHIYSPINTIPRGRVALIIDWPDNQDAVGRLIQKSYDEDGDEGLLEINSTIIWEGDDPASKARLLEPHELIRIT